MIAARLLCAVGEPYCYAETTLTTIFAGEEFTAKGKVVLSEGWKAMERKMLGELLRIIGQLAAAKRRSETLAGRIGADEDNGKLM